MLKGKNADIISKNGYFTSFIHAIQKDALIDLKITNKTSTVENVALEIGKQQRYLSCDIENLLTNRD